ncbi:hypothetical protein SERLA73DRAFT_105962 [Serpula lacrymans var. lacrymans S7.3]|uniref:non-specific serine/threonine protein kinase n=2 Tax=Serpula lacrymans var. lacrymans TaxID=341189 RepID=F8PSG6_SERL3|nr:uncharacterized protein SERLADRAFT_360933 [Serpula lacrymans var. lacrymans S7.9]EGO01296.1 hypothetical protein SERLA73DRAFT_105962 [Serpula lacrymans var. lacrymans S7.3]EGO26935.1 hypothetical protein SERLADRAFT_360933 [Serpula lacrymans var. lacrymans S7.9]
MELERSMQDDHFLCFAMELMQHDLMEVMMDDPCACRVNARRWSAQITLGIASLHEMGIIHRDIKPENVLVDARGNARIADLGAAYMHSGALHWWGEYSIDLVGTWQYMAPEVIQNKGLPKRDKKSYGIAVDYWALGCLIYELESDDHDTLFNSDMGCAGYLAWRSSHFGVVYPPLQSLNKDAASVITGLLRTAPGYRFGIRDLRRHAYFRTEAGMSEFADTEARALARPINPDFQPHLMRSTYTSELIFTPVRCSRHSKLGGEADFSRFDWDNPRSGVVVDSSIN